MYILRKSRVLCVIYAFRAINAGWVFQLNSDATFNFCRQNVDMIGFGVNSLGCQNHSLCWSLIPDRAEGHLTYHQTYNELQRTVLLLEDITPCKMHGISKLLGAYFLGIMRIFLFTPMIRTSAVCVNKTPSAYFLRIF